MGNPHEAVPGLVLHHSEYIIIHLSWMAKGEGKVQEFLSFLRSAKEAENEVEDLNSIVRQKVINSDLECSLRIFERRSPELRKEEPML